MHVQLFKLGNALAHPESSETFRKAAKDIGTTGRKIVQDEINSTFKDRTGRLRKSWRKMTRSPKKGTILRVWIFSYSPYAAIQSTGGIITPKSGKYLTVPVHAMAKRRSARSFTNTFVRGRMIYQRNSSTSATPLYALTTQVRLPGTKYMERAGKKIRIYAASRIDQAIRDLSKDTAKG
jgi:hypothetical protein